MPDTVVLEKPLRVEDVQRGHARAVRAAVPAGPMLAQALAPGGGEILDLTWSEAGRCTGRILSKSCSG